MSGYGEATKAYWAIASQTLRTEILEVRVLPCVMSGMGLPWWMSTAEKIEGQVGRGGGEREKEEGYALSTHRQPAWSART